MRKSSSLEKSFSPPASRIFASLARRSCHGGMRKSGSLENKMRRPGEADFLAPRTTVSARGMRKTGFHEKRCGDSPRSVAFRFLGRSDSRGMRKSGSARNQPRNLRWLLNSKSSGDPRNWGSFARDRRIEKPQNDSALVSGFKEPDECSPRSKSCPRSWTAPST